MYNKKIIEIFKDPKNQGELKNPDGVGQEGNTKCGDIMKLTIKVEDNIIEDIKWQTFGCPAAISSTDVLCSLVKGKTIEEALAITKSDVIEELGDVPDVKKHCSILATGALKKAIEDYLSKKEEK